MDVCTRAVAPGEFVLTGTLGRVNRRTKVLGGERKRYFSSSANARVAKRRIHPRLQGIPNIADEPKWVFSQEVRGIDGVEK